MNEPQRQALAHVRVARTGEEPGPEQACSAERIWDLLILRDWRVIPMCKIGDQKKGVDQVRGVT